MKLLCVNHLAKCENITLVSISYHHMPKCKQCSSHYLVFTTNFLKMVITMQHSVVEQDE
jgi:hypothetical protein